MVNEKPVKLPKFVEHVEVVPKRASKKVVVETWLRNLRSGNIPQTKDKLMKSSGCCCLGVLCLTLGMEPKKGWEEFEFDGCGDVLPSYAMKRAGLRHSDGRFKGDALVAMNDEGKRFKTIANLIESKPDRLFE